jgi:multiple sugar transport system substrate-binding protein
MEAVSRRSLARAAGLGTLAASLAFAGAAQAQQLLFWSNQAQPVEEAQKMREQVLAGFGKPVQFLPQEPGPFNTRIDAELKAGRGSIAIIGGLHGDFAAYTGGLVDLSGVNLGGAKIAQNYVGLGKLGTGEQKYIPWMQATYLMAANKQALQYLPAGADINKLTYAQLGEWGKKMREATGGPKLGFPAGPQGLMHRFFQGFLYPSYTKSLVTKYRSPEAERMWTEFKALWADVNPAATSYNFMQEPLLSGAVWVAWDHTARLQQALNEKPNDFVVFPVPAGPQGRGYMPVLAGLAVPKSSPSPDDAKALVAYMLKPETQIATLKATGFFPVTDVAIPADVPTSVKMSGPVVQAQVQAPDAVPSLLPVGLGTANGRFNKIFQDSFQRIVLRGEPVRVVLDEQAQAMKAIIDETKAPCWAPDKDSGTNPCPVE